MSIGKTIKERRVELNIKQETVADMMGVTVQTFSKWENEKTEPKASQIAKLAKILRLTEGELCNGQRMGSSVDQLSFMQKVSPARTFIDDVTFMSLIFNGIEDKNKFLFELDLCVKKAHGFGINHFDEMPIEVLEEAYQKMEDQALHEAEKIEDEIDRQLFSTDK